MGDVFTFRFEVLLPERGWVPNTAEALGVDEYQIGHAGDMTLYDMWEDITAFAARELDRVLADFDEDDPGLAGLAGLRVLAWLDDNSSGQPAATHTATAQQLATGRLRRATLGVQSAQSGLGDARRRLRAQVIAAKAVDRLSPQKIAHEVERSWAADLVLPYLAGFGVVHRICNILPNGWSRPLPWDANAERWIPLWESQLGPYHCGPVTIALDEVGTVTLTVNANDAEPGYWDEAEPDPEQEQARRRELRRQRLDNAEEVFPALIDAGFTLTTESGRKAQVQDLAAAPVTVTLPASR